MYGVSKGGKFAYYIDIRSSEFLYTVKMKGMVAMPRNHMSNGLTDRDRELLYGEAREKNHIDDKYNMHITEKMKEMFYDHEQVQPIGIFIQYDSVIFREILDNDFPVRNLSEAEYDAFPESDKNTKNVIRRALRSNMPSLVICLVFMAIWILSFREIDFLIPATLLMLTGIAIFVVFFGSELKLVKSRIVTRDSKAAFGNVILFRDVPVISDSGGSKYYIDAAFYGEKSYAHKVRCSRRVYDMLSQDSPIVIYNARVYAYDENGKLILD